jgi:hypothetical protein
MSQQTDDSPQCIPSHAITSTSSAPTNLVTSHLPLFPKIHRPIFPHPLLLFLRTLYVSFYTPNLNIAITHLTSRFRRHHPIDLPQVPPRLNDTIFPIPALLVNEWPQCFVDFEEEAVADSVIWSVHLQSVVTLIFHRQRLQEG